jgi:hypothetical protein
MTKVCSKCGKRKKTTEFSFRNKKIGTRRAECKECFKPLVANHYKKNRKAYDDRGIARRQASRNWILNYLSSKKCIDCDTSDIRVLEFDHTSDDKDYNVATLVSQGYGLATLEKEVAKCDVVCANCHKIRTDKQNNSYRHQYYLEHNEL